MNNKGISLIELIASIILVSIILIFMTKLFISINGIYNENKFKAECEMLKSIVIDTIASDSNKYQLTKIEKADNNEFIFYFNKARQGDISQKIVKKLKIIETNYQNKNTKIISYKYYNPNENEKTIYSSSENSENFVRVLDKRLKIKNIELVENDYTYNITIPMSLDNGEVFDINIYLKKEIEDE